MLEESGFDENPIIAPPWELAGDDHYGLSPGQIALGDVKGLQLETKRKWEAIDKKVRPPMTGPTSMRNNPASLLPGSVTYVDDPTGKGYRAAIDVNIRCRDLDGDIRDDAEGRSRVSMPTVPDARQHGRHPAAQQQFEIAERKEEKLLALGPVLENIYGGQLEPVIDRTYDLMNARGMLPPPPPELDGQKLKIEYISILAQAQKAVPTGSIERLFAFAGQLAAVKPDCPRQDRRRTRRIDIYGDYLGVPPSVVVSTKRLRKVRDAPRAKAASG
jgi:hypothetical protein